MAITASSWDVAVIGGGIGGLTAGALLARAGASVVVCEQHNRPGGYCHDWRRVVRCGGERVHFSFDAAVHDISGAYPNGPIHTILGWLGLNEQFEWGQVSHEYCFPSANLHVNGDVGAYIAALKQCFPSEERSIDRFFKIFQTSYEELYQHAALTGGLPRAPRGAAEMRRFLEQCPTLAKFIGTTFVEFRDSILSNPELRHVVSILAAYVTDDVGQLSFANMLPLFGYYFRGGRYPRGGSQALADALAHSIRDKGGRIRLRTPVTRIEVLNGRAVGVILGDGTRLRAGIVISNADPAQTFQRLVDPCHGTMPVVEAKSIYRPSNSAFMVFLALNTDPSLASSTIVVDKNEGVIISRPPFVEHRAPAGYSTLTLTGLVGTHDAHRWVRKSPLYRQMKRDAGDRLIAFASRRFPDIGKHIVYREEGSPATLQRYTWSTEAAAYGSTPGSRWTNHDTPIRGLYLVGASTGLGPGIEAVMIGGASLAERLGNATNGDLSDR